MSGATAILAALALTLTRSVSAAEPVTGLTVAFWPDAVDQQWFTTPPKMAEVVPMLDLAWQAGSGTNTTMPMKGNKYGWTARVTGAVVPPAAGDYVFRLSADDYARLLIDNRTVIDGWNTKGGSVLTSNPVKLEAGRPVALLLEFVQALGDASLKLDWRQPGASDFEVVPSSALLPHEPAGPYAVTRFRFFPRGKMKGGRLTGSDASATTEFHVLATIEQEPQPGQWSEITVANPKPYRFVKYEAPPGSYAGVAEVEFFSGDRKLSGEGFGTQGSRSGNNTWEKALDGKTNTFFDAHDADDQYVGIDLGPASQVAPPVFDPAPATATGNSVFVKLSCATPGAQIRYTLGAAAPDDSVGRLYTMPIAISKATAIAAVAFKPGLANSPAVIGNYRLESAPLKPGLKTYHIGNSLTGNAIAFFKPIFESMGYRHTFETYVRAGAPTDYYWKTEAHRDAILKQIKAGAPWDILFTQPFQGRPVPNECEFTGNFYEETLKTSPGCKLYIFQQWPKPAPKFQDLWTGGHIHHSPWGPDAGKPEVPPATNWLEGVQNHTAYYKALREALMERFPGKDVRIVPAGPALARIKQLVDAGELPGVEDFFSFMYADGIHLNPHGEYLVGLVHAAFIYEESPVGKADIPGTGLTPEQMKIFQQVAWETVQEALKEQKVEK